jgi:hypothetical protein
MDHIKQILSDFPAIDLDKLDDIKLMKRYDTKFVFHKDKLKSVFDYLRNSCQVLEIKGNRAFKYENLYYDTDTHFFYHQHHNNKLNRYKVRLRKYVDTNQSFFEVKFKNNKRKTIKTRLLLKDGQNNGKLNDESKEFARKNVLINNGDIIDQIHPAIWISFDRVTFANLINKERLTFDINLTYTDKRQCRQRVNNLIIAEIKSENISMNSPFFQYLKTLNISPSNFSKYCMGIAITEKNIRYNRFKNKLLKLKNLM